MRRLLLFSWLSKPSACHQDSTDDSLERNGSCKLGSPKAWNSKELGGSKPLHLLHYLRLVPSVWANRSLLIVNCWSRWHSRIRYHHDWCFKFFPILGYTYRILSEDYFSTTCCYQCFATHFFCSLTSFEIQNHVFVELTWLENIFYHEN